MKEYREYQAYYEDYNNSFLWLFLIIGIILLFFIVNGIAFSIFDFSLSGTLNPIYANIVFNYSDINGGNNGLYLENLNSVSDEVGKKLISDKSYFDFNVSGNAKNYNLKYTILIKKDDISTLDENYVKVYLTKISGSIESEISSYVNVYSDFDDIEVDGIKYKKLYTSYLSNTTKFEDDYRLRMWVSSNAVDFYEKTFSAKVSIIAESVGE